MKTEVSREQLRKAKLGVCFVALIALIFVIVFSINVYKGLSGPITSINWIPHQATLISVAIDETVTKSTSENRSQYTLYAPRIMYKYTTDGNEHIGRKVTWNEIYDDGFMLRLAHELKRKLAAAKPIVVYVNPNNGAESILIKNVIWEHMSMLLVGFVISWAALLWFVYILAFKLKYQK